jgi:hypothetical protein
MPNHTWGLVSVNIPLGCRKGSMHQDPIVGRPYVGQTTSCEAVSRENCRLLKAAGKASRCFAHRNFELVLEWLESQL